MTSQLPWFVLLCVLMVVAAVWLALWPLYKARHAEQANGARNRSVMVLIAVSVLMLCAGLYVTVSKEAWNVPATAQVSAEQAMAADLQAELTAFEARVNTNPQDTEGWILLGSARNRAQDLSGSMAAYEKAFALSEGKNLDARAGLAESLILADTTSLNGRAALLINEGLQQAPMHPKLLWYGGLVAMQGNDFKLARSRFQALMQLNPPDNVRAVLTRQIDDINAQLGEAGPASATTTGERRLTVRVTLSPALQSKLAQPLTLFILARNPAQPGPPLAVERHQSSELPLTVELTNADAMMPTRTLASAEQVEVVARLSASGTPTGQPGDLYGTATFSFAKQGNSGEVNISIDRQMP